MRLSQWGGRQVEMKNIPVAQKCWVFALNHIERPGSTCQRKKDNEVVFQIHWAFLIIALCQHSLGIWLRKPCPPSMLLGALAAFVFACVCKSPIFGGEQLNAWIWKKCQTIEGAFCGENRVRFLSFTLVWRQVKSRPWGIEHSWWHACKFCRLWFALCF